MRAVGVEPRPVGPILLVVGLPDSRILILRIVRETTAITVRALVHVEPFRTYRFDDG
jgi:hypothetical protein